MMNILLWVLQVLAALLYTASGVMKVFLFDKVSKDVPSFGCVATGSMAGPGCPGARVCGWADRPRRPPLAAAADAGPARTLS